MTEEQKRPKYKSWILECINLLRGRKSRPDLERICRTMQKCHGIEERDTEEDLAALVSAGVVTKRSFKGAISYRNASGWQRSVGSGKASRATRWVSEAIRALDRGHGVHLPDIENFISEQHPYYHNLKARIKLVLKDDMESGRIWTASEGLYRLLESAESPEREIPMRAELVCDFCLQTKDCNRNGVPESLLICQDCGNKAHPTCMNYSQDLVSRVDANSWQCIDCKTCIICNDSGDPGSLLFCDACDKGYHMQCHRPPLQTMPIGKWICYNCQHHPTNPARLEEPVSFTNGPSGSSLPKTGMQVVPTHRRNAPSGQREIRMECDEQIDLDLEETVEVKDIHIQVDAASVKREMEKLSQATPPGTPPLEISSASQRTADREPNRQAPQAAAAPVGSKGRSQPCGDVEMNGAADSKNDLSANTGALQNGTVTDTKLNSEQKSVPDASSWEVSDVVSYFSKMGYVEEAKSFEDQEIDGKALLLMSRNDVLTGMSFKLGPALKIYVHVARLQGHSSTT